MDTNEHDSIELVEEFHHVFGQPVEVYPSVDDEVINRLRVRLLREEVKELEDALSDRDPVAVLDALSDLQYVLDGSYLSLGFAAVSGMLCAANRPVSEDVICLGPVGAGGTVPPLLS